MPDIVYSFLQNTAAFIIILSVIVFVHEYGHYIVARWCGVKVEVFSIGFGKELFGRYDKHGTRWKVCLIPMGGYVKMFGDADPASSPDSDKIEELTEEEKKQAFYYKPLYKKAAVVAAGPAFNFILTFVVLTGLFTVTGKTTALPVIAETVKESAAEKAGLQPGDRILAIDGEEAEAFTDIIRAMSLNTGTPVDLRVRRDEEEFNVTVTPEVKEAEDIFGNEIRKASLGIVADSASFSREELSFVSAMGHAVSETGNFITSTLKAVGQMITGARDLSEISGPIGIAKYSGQAAEKDVVTILWFIAILSANLGLVNLFPIPALDGGHLAFYAVEAVRGRPMAEKYQEIGIKFGIGLILVFAVFAVYNDLRKIFG